MSSQRDELIEAFIQLMDDISEERASYEAEIARLKGAIDELEDKISASRELQD